MESLTFNHKGAPQVRATHKQRDIVGALGEKHSGLSSGVATSDHVDCGTAAKRGFHTLPGTVRSFADCINTRRTVKVGF
jgi:hypothetical protein